MINVIASIQINEGRRESFVDIFKSNVSLVIKEKECIEYLPTIDVPKGLAPQELNDKVVTVIEKWHSLEDLHTHLLLRQLNMLRLSFPRRRESRRALDAGSSPA